MCENARRKKGQAKGMSNKNREKHRHSIMIMMKTSDESLCE
jgi:hypothetical protein